MNLKRFSIFALLFLTLIIGISAISAADVVGDVSSNDPAMGSGADVVGDVSSNDSAKASTTEPSVSSQANATSTTKKISTKVSANQVANEYKKSQYFNVKVKDKKGKLLKNVKINLKVFTGSKSKVYTVKTNSKGIAKFNTKSLKLGNHKVAISSADKRYKISKTSKIFIGKKHYAILKLNTKKVLKNKDVLGLKVKNDGNEKEVDVVYKKTPKYTKVTKAIFYLKNKKTGKIVKLTDKASFDDGVWELPDKDFSNKYSLVKVKVWYLSSK